MVMTKYKCIWCSTTLETNESEIGKQEPCPVCHKINVVPPSKRYLEKQDAIIAKRAKDAKNQNVEDKTGENLVFLGILLVIMFFWLGGLKGCVNLIWTGRP